VHFTKRILGDIEAGPNAVLAFAPKGIADDDQSRGNVGHPAYGGFWAMAGKYWRTGLYEMYRSLSKRAFLLACSVWSDARTSQLEPAAPACERKRSQRTGY